MCGIAGFVGAPFNENEAIAKLQLMSDAIKHRGPDDDGVFTDPQAGVGLAHRRLSIIDLTPSGHQPMTSHDQRYVLTYNGEVYNFETLRRQLEAFGHPFRGASDTEVLLAAVVQWGVFGMLERAVGMFAFALWDRRHRSLYLARDRLGEKPLYLTRLERGFAFASELTALRNAGFTGRDLDFQALAAYLRFGYIPAPYSIHANTIKLLPGSVVAITEGLKPPPDRAPWALEQQHHGHAAFSSKYWHVSAMTPADMEAKELEGEFDALLHAAVRQQLRADVPVGAFLSGGIDSSLVCSIAQSVSSEAVKTFTIGFGDSLFDESDYARNVAAHLGTEHTSVNASPKDVMDLVPRIADICDEPFADPSLLPTFMVSQLARTKVTVALTGDGGDELFCGYNRYVQPTRVRQKFAWIPAALLNVLSKGLERVPADGVDRLVDLLSRWSAAKGLRVQSPGKKLHKTSQVLTADDAVSLYRMLMSHWADPLDLLRADATEPDFFAETADVWTWESFADQAMAWDLAHYLPDNNLAKVDRASMAVSLETRLPLLDHRLVEFAMRVPLSAKISDGKGKLLMRNALARYLPAELINRPKLGFSVPISDWLRGPLREWGEDLLSAATTERIGWFDADKLQKSWQAHVSGRSDFSLQLWLVIVAHAWHLSVE